MYTIYLYTLYMYTRIHKSSHVFNLSQLLHRLDAVLAQSPVRRLKWRALNETVTSRTEEWPGRKTRETKTMSVWVRVRKSKTVANTWLT